MVITSVFLVFIVLRERSRKNNTKEREARIKEKVEPILREIVFSQQDSDEFKAAIKEIEKVVDHKFYREANLAILNELIIYYHQNLGGESFNRLEELYGQVGLKQRSLDILKNKKINISTSSTKYTSSLR
jgi:hypothetical protein